MACPYMQYPRACIFLFLKKFLSQRLPIELAHLINFFHDAAQKKGFNFKTP